MIRHWGAVEADLAAVYGIRAPELAALTMRRFLTLISGLPAGAKFPRAWRATPRHVTDPAEIARLTGQPIAPTTG